MPKVLAVFAHPDDIELLCGGTLHLLVKAGWGMRCVTMSGGDLGSSSGTREAIREKRLKEAASAAQTLGGSYAWAGMHDFQIYYCPEQIALTTKQVRDFAPDVVITHSPDCYLIDHEETSRLVRMACFAGGVPLFDCGAKPTTNGVPALYYADALEGKDKLGNEVTADFWIDVASVFDIRQEALTCHESQREWLRSHHGIDEYLITNERIAREHGAKSGVAFAEGFRQHLGHGYPSANKIAEALPKFTIPRPQK